MPTLASKINADSRFDGPLDVDQSFAEVPVAATPATLAAAAATAAKVAGFAVGAGAVGGAAYGAYRTVAR